MSALWAFLLKEKNRLVLAWIGSGTIVVVAGLWTAFTYLYPVQRPDPPARDVTATTGGIAIGGSVSNSKIGGGNSSPK
jgi:hypothetical protein